MVGTPNTTAPDAGPDPLAPFVPMVRSHLNGEHVDSLVFVVRILGGEADAVGAEALHADRKGLTVRVDRADGSSNVVTLAFANDALDVGAVQREAAALVAQARLESGEDGLTSFERQAAALAALQTHITSVSHVHDLTPLVRQITFRGGDLAHFEWLAADQFLYVLVPPVGCDHLAIDQSFRWEQHSAIPEAERPVGAYYTVREWRPDTHEIVMQFVLHEHGDASDWARRAKPGDIAALWGPRTSFTPPSTPDWYLLVADDTAAPALQTVVEQLPSDARVHAFIEVADEAEHRAIGVDRPRVEVNWLYRNGVEPGASQALVDAVRAMPWPDGDVYVWGGGESKVMTAVRKYVRRERGVERDSVSLLAYWRHAAHPFDPEEEADR